MISASALAVERGKSARGGGGGCRKPRKKREEEEEEKNASHIGMEALDLEGGDVVKQKKDYPDAIRGCCHVLVPCFWPFQYALPIPSAATVTMTLNKDLESESEEKRG